MRWPWQRRREAPRHALPRPAARWAEPALPSTPAPAAAAAPRAQALVPAPVVSPAACNGVRLGFLDGSEATLPTGDPRAAALRAVADSLLRGVDRPSR